MSRLSPQPARYGMPTARNSTGHNSKAPPKAKIEVDAVMNADNDLALVTNDPSLQTLKSVSYRRRDGRLLGHYANGSTTRLGHLAKPMIGRLQGCRDVLLVSENPDGLPLETSVTLDRHP